MCACGALVAILLQDGLLEGTGPVPRQDFGAHLSLVRVRKVSEVALSGYLTVDQLSLQALQIFQVLAPFHPLILVVAALYIEAHYSPAATGVETCAKGQCSSCVWGRNFFHTKETSIVQENRSVVSCEQDTLKNGS